MTMIRFEIAAELVVMFPDIHVCGLRAHGVASALQQLDTVALIGEATASVDHGADEIARLPVIAAWRKAYGSMGAKPSKFRGSIEALMRRAAKGSDLSRPQPAVNLYNACSIKCCAPIGAYDTMKLPGSSISLRFAEPDRDRFNPIGGEASSFPLFSSLVVYAINNDVLCWGFNCRDSSIAALDEESDDLVFFSEAVDPRHRERSTAALIRLRDYIVGAGAECSETRSANKQDRAFVI